MGRFNLASESGLLGAKKKRERQRANLAGLIQGDETISEDTKKELLAGVEAANALAQGSTTKDASNIDISGQQFATITSTLGDAREGKGDKFKGRQAAKARSSLLLDRPGRNQLLLSR